jgi:hypothetical protein
MVKDSLLLDIFRYRAARESTVGQNLESAAVRSIMRGSLGRRWDRRGLRVHYVPTDKLQPRASCSVRNTKNMIAGDPVGWADWHILLTSGSRTGSRQRTVVDSDLAEDVTWLSTL